MLDSLSAAQTSARNQKLNLHKICKMSCCLVDGHSWRQRQNWHSGTKIKENIKEIICTILHCIELGFKYGSSVRLETTENSLQTWQTEVLGDPCVQSQLLDGFCISCGVQDNTHLHHLRFRKLQYCSAPHGSATGQESLSRCYLYMNITIYGNIKAINFSGISALLFIVWKIFEGCCDFF